MVSSDDHVSIVKLKVNNFIENFIICMIGRLYFSRVTFNAFWAEPLYQEGRTEYVLFKAEKSEFTAKNGEIKVEKQDFCALAACPHCLFMHIIHYYDYVTFSSNGPQTIPQIP